MTLKIILLVVCGLLSAGLAYTAEPEDDVNTPFRYAKGKIMFDHYCSSCHGLKLTGTDKGPPLIHNFYKPSHHGDGSFYNAALKGVKSHHWNFGDMPPVTGMTEKKIRSIVPYVRFYQQQKKLY